MKIGGKKENSILGCFYHKLDPKCPQTEHTLPPHVVVNAERIKSLFFFGWFFVFVSELLPGMVIIYCKQHFFKRVLLKNHGSFQKIRAYGFQLVVIIKIFTGQVSLRLATQMSRLGLDAAGFDRAGGFINLTGKAIMKYVCGTHCVSAVKVCNCPDGWL